MFLFGLTWLFAALTVNIGGNQALRLTFQALFVITASFQGFFIFLFFCVLKKEARKAWKDFLLCGKYKKKQRTSYSITSARMTYQGSLRSNHGRSSIVSAHFEPSKTETSSSTMVKIDEEEINTKIPLEEKKEVKEVTDVVILEEKCVVETKMNGKNDKC